MEPAATPPHIFAVNAVDSGNRLDHYLHSKLPDYSRSRIQEWIKQGAVLVDGSAQKPSYSLRGAENILVHPSQRPSLRAFAEDLPVSILYEDADVIAVNKPAGMVVHSGAGAHSGTLVNALLHRFATLSRVGGEERPGIVHRLDRDTSGVLLVARTDRAHARLAEQFASRQVEKIYLALAEGKIQGASGIIDSRVGRHPVHRTRMAAGLATGRTAWTEYQVLEQFEAHTFLRVQIKTGRTHQIRVHLSSLGHPVAGDSLYGGKPGACGRFFLHAHSIRFESPSSGEGVLVQAPLAPELDGWLKKLRVETANPPKRPPKSRL